jgi:lipooligosaccharide transport system ATP-binding protein
MTAPVIEAVDLRKAYNGFIAVDGISFSVQSGECFGLLGPNGAGKTTTIRMLYGYSPASGGSLKIFGEPLAENLRAIKQRMGVCQQEDNLDPDLSVEANLLVFARYFDIPLRQAREEAGKLLRFFALAGRADTAIRELSGGMKRRLMLARSLINRPDLLILDEPTTGLDPQSRHQVWQRLEELKATGLTILLTSHYMEEAARLCDRLLIMDHGQVLVEGAPKALIERYVGREVIEVNAPAPAMVAFLTEAKIEYEAVGQRLLIYNQSGSELFTHLNRELSCAGCSLRQATLEDVFLRLTGRELRD